MRTTITLDDAVLDDLKQRAAQRGTTVSRVIEDSVRLALAKSPEPPGTPAGFELVTYGAYSAEGDRPFRVMVNGRGVGA